MIKGCFEVIASEQAGRGNPNLGSSMFGCLYRKLLLRITHRQLIACPKLFTTPTSPAPHSRGNRGAQP